MEAHCREEGPGIIVAILQSLARKRKGLSVCKHVLIIMAMGFCANESYILLSGTDII